MATLNEYIQSFIFEEIDKNNLLELEKILKPDKVMDIINSTIEERCGELPDNIFAQEIDVKLNKNNSGVSIKSVYAVEISKSTIRNITLLFKIFSSDINNNSNEKNNKFRVCIDGESKSTNRKIYEELDCDIVRDTSHTDGFYKSMISSQIDKALDNYLKRVVG